MDRSPLNKGHEACYYIVLVLSFECFVMTWDPMTGAKDSGDCSLMQVKVPPSPLVRRLWLLSRGPQ